MLDLEAELEICKAATAGPWVAEWPWMSKPNMVDDSDEQHARDMQFESRARTILPPCLEALLAIRELCERYDGNPLAGELRGILEGLK